MSHVQRYAFDRNSRTEPDDIAEDRSFDLWARLSALEALDAGLEPDDGIDGSDDMRTLVRYATGEDPVLAPYAAELLSFDLVNLSRDEGDAA